MIIYKTINLINGKIYIGQDSKNNPEYLGSGLLLKRAIEKYGVENFEKEIICECDSKKSLNESEIFWIRELSGVTNGYNLTLGGSGGDTYSNNPNLELIKKKFKGELNPFFNKQHSIDSKIKMSNSQKGREAWNKGLTGIYNEEHIQNLKKAKLGKTGDTASRYIKIDEVELQDYLNNHTIENTANYFNVSVTCIRNKIKEFNLVVTRKNRNFEKNIN